jgi:hypothetical protein
VAVKFRGMKKSAKKLGQNFHRFLLQIKQTKATKRLDFLLYMSVSSRNTRRPQRTITNNGKLNLVQICLDNIVNNIDYWTAYLDPLTLNKSKWIITPFDALPEPQRFIPALISRLSEKSKFNEITLGVFLVHNLQYLSVTAPFINDSYVELICKR